MNKIFTFIAFGVSTQMVLAQPLINSRNVTGSVVSVEYKKEIRTVLSSHEINQVCNLSRIPFIIYPQNSVTTEVDGKVELEIMTLFSTSLLSSIKGGILKDLKIILAPNPVIDILTLDFKNQEGGIFDLQITDERGSVVMNDKMDIATGAKYDINLAEFPKGTYILTLRNFSGVWSEKIVKIQ